jgi:hypothetical protein
MGGLGVEENQGGSSALLDRMAKGERLVFPISNYAHRLSIAESKFSFQI